MMNRILQKALHTGICLSVGFSMGLNLADANDVSIAHSKAHDGEIVNSHTEFYDDMIQNVNAIEIYDTSKLTPQIMANRNGKIIVERIVGEVANYKLDGKILNCDADDGGYTNKDGGNYISYQRVEGAKEGDKILTYFIYNPFSNAQDDVWTRLDFIIDDNAI